MKEYPALRVEPRNAPTPLGPPGSHFSFLEWLRQQGRLIEREPYDDESDEERPIETIDRYLEPSEQDSIDPDFDNDEEITVPPNTDSDALDEDGLVETNRQNPETLSTERRDRQEPIQSKYEIQASDIQTLEPIQKISEDESTSSNEHKLQDLILAGLNNESDDYFEDLEFMTEEVKAQITRIDQHIVQLLEWSNQYNLFFEQNIKVDHNHTHKSIHIVEEDKSDLKSLLHQIGRRIEAIENAKREISDSIFYLDQKLDRYQDEVLGDLKVKHTNLKLSVPEGFQEKIRCHLSDTLQEDLLPEIQEYLSNLIESNNEEISESEKAEQLKATLQEALAAFDHRKDKVIDHYIDTLQARNQELEQENETVKTLRNIISEQEIQSKGSLAEKERLIEQLAALEEERKKLRQDYSHSITEASDLRQQIQELQDTHQQDLQNAQSEKLQLLQDSEAQIRGLGRQHQQALDKAQADRQELTADLDTYQRLVAEREQQLQLLRASLTTSLKQIAERLDNPETGDTHNSPESLSSDSFADLRQSLLVINDSLQAIPSISAALVAQIRHAEEQLTSQNQHLQDLTQARDALQTERDSARAELATSQETLNAQVAEKSQLTGKLQALETQYVELEEKHHQSILERGKLQERITYLERSEQAQREAQQQCEDKLRETQQQLEEEREKPKLFGLFNRSKGNTPQDS